MIHTIGHILNPPAPTFKQFFETLRHRAKIKQKKPESWFSLDKISKQMKYIRERAKIFRKIKTFL